MAPHWFCRQQNRQNSGQLGWVEISGIEMKSLEETARVRSISAYMPIVLGIIIYMLALVGNAAFG